MNRKVFLKEKVLCITNIYCLSYKNGFLKVYNTETNHLLFRQKIERGIKSKGLFSRLLRTEPRCATMVDDYTAIISHNGKIIRYDLEHNKIFTEHYFDKGMKNPLQFCTIEKEHGKREIYYGEYIWNTEQGPVSIYKRDNHKWEKIYDFPAGTITHIHNIIYDDKRKWFYILTGDSDKGSGIWIADRTFLNVYPLMLGKQQYRACVAFPTDDGLMYATDTPLEANHVVKVVLHDNQVSDIDVLCEIPGPCIYGTSIGGNYYFATSVEPDSTLSGLRYKITRKLGKGVVGRYAHIIVINESGEMTQDFKEKKDVWPMWLFQFGNFLFPFNTTNELYATSQALSCGHGVTIKLERY